MSIEAEIIEPTEKTGRPTQFSQQIADQILDRIIEGELLTAICRDEAMPLRKTFYAWMASSPAFKETYACARLAWCDWWAEKSLTISLDSSGDIFIDDKGKALIDHANVQRSRQIVDTIKWIVGKYGPRTYGDRPLPEVADTRNELRISWDDGPPTQISRIIVDPIYDENGNIIPVNDNDRLRARIAELEIRLGIREGEPLPPKQLTYDPGPLPSRTEGQILYSIAQAIKTHVPRADQRSPEEVISEVMVEFENLLKAKYSLDAA